MVSTVAYAVEPVLSFDLSGPKVDVRVRRGAATLPIGETPNLQAIPAQPQPAAPRATPPAAPEKTVP